MAVCSAQEGAVLGDEEEDNDEMTDRRSTISQQSLDITFWGRVIELHGLSLVLKIYSAGDCTNMRSIQGVWDLAAIA